MSESAPPYGADPAPAGWYTLGYAGAPPAPPAWTGLLWRLDAPGIILLFRLQQGLWLNAAEAEMARAVPLPEGLELRYTGPGNG